MKLTENYMSLYITFHSVTNIFQVLYKLFNLQTAHLAQGQLYKMQRLYVRRICKKWALVLNLVPCCFTERKNYNKELITMT